MFYVGGEKFIILIILFQLSMFGMVASDPRFQSILKCNVDIRDQYFVATATAADPKTSESSQNVAYHCRRTHSCAYLMRARKLLRSTVFRLSLLLCLIDVLTDLLKAVQRVTSS